MVQQVEVVDPKYSAEDFFTKLFVSLFVLAIRVLFVWWAVAVWFPELGLTYWQLVLPVYAVRMLVTPDTYRRTAKS